MSDPSQLATRVASLEGAAVLCVGDVMLDRFVYGDVERISPEAPIPVLRVLRESAMLGGAGNVVRNLVALGAKPYFVTVLGDDAAAGEVTRLVGEHPEVVSELIVEDGRLTTIKTRYFAGSQQLLRADHETLRVPAEAIQARILAAVDDWLPSVGVVVLSDYGKGVLAAPMVRALIERCVRAGRPVLVDPKGTDYSIYAGATLMTPNRKELREATGLPVGNDEEIVAACRQLIEAFGIHGVLATRSQHGMSLVLAQGEVHHLPAEAREVFDVSGAGDTVVATMATAIAGGLDAVDAARLANVAAGIVVGKVGTAVAYGSDVAAALLHGETESKDGKVLPRNAAVDQVERWRRRGQRIGFTNGCFDLLHPGHVSLLDQAKSHCDRLVVGLNSDRSVQRLKGASRPIQSETARATVLASLASVDLVVIFTEDTPLELITSLQPEVLVKGADYTVEQVVGAEVVQRAGGKVVLAQLAAGHSTTATIARMNK
ncbi:MAG TPA: D-glycero-beta-D-manno-heptose-7-phosphate kinase [Rhodospirillaceae bacterium]|nr:D-glycero-beta-D-manno-heptose-7-phosphate kinase [Rhodospirillaceae bacterium]